MIKPHLNRYWLTPAYEADFEIKVSDINGLYEQAPELAKQGQRFESIDEMTGVQPVDIGDFGIKIGFVSWG